MFRCCISILVIMGLFVSQLAAIPHAHAGFSVEEQREHDATPHFHCHNHHGHGHSHDGHSHQNDQHSDPAKTSGHEPPPDGLNGGGHDATAIYCPSSVTAGSICKQRLCSVSLLAGLAAFVNCQPLTDLGLSRSGIEHGRPPDKVLDGSNLYLTLRNLRI